MKKNKVITVVVPTYNVEKYLDRCLLSLTFDKEVLGLVEIIIVNDGSKDRSLAIANEYKSRFPNSIKVVDKENGGHGSTINSGLKLAKGKYFRVIDSDDWVNVDDFGSYVKQLDGIDTDVVLTDYSRELVYSGESVLKQYKDIKYGETYSLDSIDLDLLDGEYFYLATTTIKTNKLREANLVLDEKTFYVDMEYVVLPVSHISSFTYLKYDIYRYWIGRPQQSIDKKNTFKNRLHHEKVLLRLIGFYNSQKLTKNKRQYVENIIVLMMNTHYLIYCGQKIPSNAVPEIRKFDERINKLSPALYRSVAIKFPYIDYYRKTNFVFTNILHGYFFKITELIVTKKQVRGGV